MSYRLRKPVCLQVISGRREEQWPCHVQETDTSNVSGASWATVRDKEAADSCLP